MPDHLHALLSFPPSGKPLRLIISKWKEWTAKELGIVWQRDFFEHRLRHDESRREKADYILHNPVRNKLLPVCCDRHCAECNARESAQLDSAQRRPEQTGRTP